MGLFAAAVDKLKSKKLKEEGCVVTLQIEVPAPRVQAALQNALVRIQGRAQVPGFRPGKAPMEIIQKHFAEHAREKALDQLLRDCLPETLREHQIDPVTSPTVRTVRMDAGKPLTFELVAECSPKVEARNYTKLPATRKSYPAEEAEVLRRLEELREGNARLEAASVDAVGREHYVIVDYHASADGKPLQGVKGSDMLLDMSAPNPVEGLPEGLLGAKRGEARDIPVKLQGRRAVFHAAVKEIKTKILPPMDEELAKDIGFASLEALKADLRRLIEQEGTRRCERELLRQIQEGLLRAHPFPVPPSQVEIELERVLDRLKSRVSGPRREWPQAELQKLRAELRPKAEEEVRLAYLLRAIGRAEKIAATPQEIEEELRRGLEEAKTESDKDALRRLFDERKEEIAGMILERKVLAFVKNSADVKDA